MDYFINEYSLRGQFKDIDEFFSSLRKDTFPVLNRIQTDHGNLIWKKEDFWNSKICQNITIMDILKGKHRRAAEITKLKSMLAKLVYSEPFWSEDDDLTLEIKEYCFDESFRDNFETSNCFTKAIKSEGRMISFLHSSYKLYELPIKIYNGKEMIITIDNIYTVEWWKHQPEIKKWKHLNYEIQVRAKEYDYHPPHFHVFCNEYEAVFDLKNGKIYKDGKEKWTLKMINDIEEWYQIHKAELQASWDALHTNLFKGKTGE